MQDFINGGYMFSNIVKAAFRAMKKQSVSTIINVSGLAIALAVCIVLFLYIRYESGFDRHIPDAGAIYRVVTHENNPGGKSFAACVPLPMAEALRIDFPELGQVTQVFRTGYLKVNVNNEIYREGSSLFVEPEFFGLFDVNWIERDLSDAKRPNSVVLTEKVARKYFGTAKAAGRRLHVNSQLDLYVTGVVENPPRQTNLPYDMLISFTAMEGYYSSLENWGVLDESSQVFFKLPPEVSPAEFEKYLRPFAKKYLKEDHKEKWTFHLQPLLNMHNNAVYRSYPYVVSKTALLILAGTGLLILFVACINYINLATAQSMRRNKEIGMRKILGAGRTRIVNQILGETSIAVGISIILSIVFSSALLPWAERFIGQNAELSFSGAGFLIPFLLILFFVLVAVNGIYPAFLLSRYEPSEMLAKGAVRGRKTGFSASSKCMVLAQFAIAQILLTGTIIASLQLGYINKKDLGFRRQGIVFVKVPDYEEAACEALRARWLQNSAIRDVSFAWRPPSSGSNFITDASFPGKSDDAECPVMIKMCDSHYLDVYDIPLEAGTFFTSNTGDEEHASFVVNKKTLDFMDITNTWDAVGQEIVVNDTRGTIVGVTADFHTLTLREPLKPAVFFNFWPANHNEAHIRFETNDMQAALVGVREIWEETYPGQMFEYSFLDEQLHLQYSKEKKIMQMARISSMLAVFLCCLGLLGFISMMLVRRTKEIGVRKVLGASVTNLLFMFSKDFSVLVICANIFAWPLAWIVASRWLGHYAYHVNLTVWPFLLSGFIALGVTFVTVSVQSLKEAGSNPVEAIRHE